MLTPQHTISAGSVVDGSIVTSLRCFFFTTSLPHMLYSVFIIDMLLIVTVYAFFFIFGEQALKG